MNKPTPFEYFVCGYLTHMGLTMFFQDLLGKEWCYNNWVDLSPVWGYGIAVFGIIWYSRMRKRDK